MYASFWLKYGFNVPEPQGVKCWRDGLKRIPLDGHTCESMAVGILDFQRKELRAQQQLDPPNIFADAIMVEKNWAFFEHKGELLIAYSLLPCTIILR